MARRLLAVMARAIRRLGNGRNFGHQPYPLALAPWPAEKKKLPTIKSAASVTSGEVDPLFESRNQLHPLGLVPNSALSETVCMQIGAG
jgi:hypothetical protein